MFSIFFTFLMLISASTNVLCRPKYVPCDLTDDVCVTEATKRHYSYIASGIQKCGVDSSDPIHLDVIEVTLPTLNYTLTDAYFHGMKDCLPDKLNFNFEEMVMNFYLICPRLTLESNYNFKGDIGSMFTEGNGKCSIVHDDYYIGLRMNIENLRGADGKRYFNFKSFVLSPLEVRGAVVYNLENPYYGDKEKSEAAHKFFNENWKIERAMNAFMAKFVANINQYFKVVSVDEMFFEDV